ncbi:MAG TPA: phosphopantothenoylcysteine decarboxylase [Puia sp.]|uniref:phosphopantothenoylcysteine decarboxylase n=1 Tax=Puia sp. TaxID=2045100 RepID=UPI002C6CBC8A|nr:phosphopantothenoylcysteine decarboxylase [Puia sp.]HVU94428.1 phosphopantothenoylcysteine decarboxylase [Puia sp.]
MHSQKILSGKKVLITAGPTQEALDPVRFISNHSSGRMGYSLAKVLLNRGAQVTLVSGPVHLKLAHPALRIYDVVSAREMLAACQARFDETDIAIFAAAVADYRPETVAATKIKKRSDTFQIRMVRNPDIASEFGRIKLPHQYSVGFALETNDELEHAREKLIKKNLDMVVLNSLNDPGACFASANNKITLLRPGIHPQSFPLKDKRLVAIDIIDAIAADWANQAKLSSQSPHEYENMYR